MSEDEKEPMYEEEDRLTDMLMETCTPYGDERLDELAGSGVGLMNCGMLYLTRGELSIDLEQKMNYIKSATLLTAAKFRFDLICDATWSRDVSASITQLHSSILRNLRREDKSGMILETIDNVKKRLHRLREEQSVELAKIEMIDTSVSLKEEIVLQKKKIKNVKSLLEKATKDYKFLMYHIANRCESIVGTPPCKFALVGLGSVAKGEVTLHSSFNYVIVLEENVQHREDYFRVQDYFRWFATVFQVIIVGLGETLVTSVGVEGLGDFTDIYTPSGVAIDGMMPLIGELHTLRLVPVASMVNPFEFIKPVSEMIQLWRLCNYTDIGFDLRRLMRNFCYVYGNEGVFDEFSESAYLSIFRHHTILIDGSLVASFNMAEMLRASPFIEFNLPNATADSCFYRPFSACLAYIATVFRWKSHSGFEIISSMKNFSSDLGVVCGRKPKCHRLELALATCCLARMRLFATGNGSRLKTYDRSIFNFIEEKSLRITIQQMWHLSRNLQGIRKYAICGKSSDLKPSKISMEIGKNLESSLKDQLNILETNKNLNQLDKDYILHNCIHTALRLLNINNKIPDVASFDIAKRYLSRHPGTVENQSASIVLLAIHLEQGNHEEVVKLVESHFSRCRFGDPSNTLRIRKFHLTALLTSRPPREVIQYCDNALAEFKDAASQLVFTFARIVSRIDVAGKRRDLIDLVDLTVKENAKFFKVKDVLIFLEEVFTYQFKCKWYQDAILTIEVAYSMLESRVQVFAPFEFYRLVGGEPARCYMEILPKVKDTFKAVKMLTRVLSICKTAQFREDCLSSFMDALLYLHDKYQKKPMKYVRRLIDQYIAVVPDHLKSLPLVKDVLQSYEEPSIVTKSEPNHPEPAVNEIRKSAIDEQRSEKSEVKRGSSDLAKSVSDTSEPGRSKPTISESSQKCKTEKISVTAGSNRPESNLNEISKPSIKQVPFKKCMGKGQLPVETGSNRPESSVNEVPKPFIIKEPSEKYMTKRESPVKTGSNQPEFSLDKISKTSDKLDPIQIDKMKEEIPITIKPGSPKSNLKTISKSSIKPFKKYGRYDEIFGKSATRNVKVPTSSNFEQSVEDRPQRDDATSNDYKTASKRPTNAKATKSLDAKRNKKCTSQRDFDGFSDSSMKSNTAQTEIRPAHVHDVASSATDIKEPSNSDTKEQERNLTTSDMINDSSQDDVNSKQCVEGDSSNKNQELAEGFEVDETIPNADCGNQHDLIRDKLKKSIQPISEGIESGNLCPKNFTSNNKAELSKSDEAKRSQTEKTDLKYSTSTEDIESSLTVDKIKSIGNESENVTTNLKRMKKREKRLKSAGSEAKDSPACESNQKILASTKDSESPPLKKVKSNKGANLSEFITTNDKSQSPSKAASDTEAHNTSDDLPATTDDKSPSAKCIPDSDTDIHHTPDGSLSRSEDANERRLFRNSSSTTSSRNSMSDSVESMTSKTERLSPSGESEHCSGTEATSSETDTCSTVSEEDVTPCSCNIKNTAASYSSTSSSESVDDVTHVKTLDDARRPHSSSDDSEEIPKVASFKIDVKITRVGRKTNVHLVVRESKPQTPADCGSKSACGKER